MSIPMWHSGLKHVFKTKNVNIRAGLKVKMLLSVYYVHHFSFFNFKKQTNNIYVPVISS